MNYSILLTEQAKTDIVAIYRYIAEELQSPQNAEGQLTRIETAITSLKQMPERYRVYESPKWKKRNLRIMPIDNYVVFYVSSTDDESVTVVRVMYGGRDLEKQLERGLLTDRT